MKRSDHKAYENILVPIDFSNNAARALRFALQLAEKNQAKITLFHVYHPSFDAANPYMNLPAETYVNMKNDLMREFREKHVLESGGAVATKQKVDQKLVLGFAAEEIVNASKDYDLIVMGTTGKGNVFETFFGSVSSHTAQHAHCPVLLIPMDWKDEKIQDVLFASNYSAVDEVMIPKVIQLGLGDLKCVHWVHVEVEGENRSEELDMPHVRTTLPDGSHIETIKSKVVNKNVWKGLASFGTQHSVDLIVVGTIHRSFLEHFFHKSITKQAVFNSEVPILIFHYDD